MALGRGPQVVYLNDGAQLASRGAYGRTMRENVAYKELLEGLGTSSDGYTVDGTTRTGLAAEDALYGREQLADGNSNYVNVIGLGAVGDGVHNDGPAILAAIEALGGQPGTVYFPPGRYLWAGDGAIIPSSTRITGAGPGVSVIVQSAAMTPGPGGFYPIFRSTNVITAPGGAETTLPTTPENQTDHDIQIDSLGFDLSQMGAKYTIVFAFLLARDLIVDNVNIYKPRDTTGYSGFRFYGCDNISVTNYVARGAQNVIDICKGTTRLRVSDCMFESYQGGGNGGLICWNGNGLYIADFAHSIGFQLSNATFWLYSGKAIFLDCLGPGSSCQNMLLSDIVISARTGTNNTGIICRGWVNRLKCRNISFDAQPPAPPIPTTPGNPPIPNPTPDMTPFIVGGLFTPTPTQAAAVNRITTTNGSNQFTVSWSDGAILGPGNYLHIATTDPDHPTVIGNGLSLNGYYLIVAVSGPIHDPGAGVLSELREGRAPNATSNGNLFTCIVQGQTANASGPINVVTGVQGYFGHPKACEFQGITFDGISAAGSDLMHIGCNVLRIDGVTVTDNYNGEYTIPVLPPDAVPTFIPYTAPRYRSIVGATDSIRLDGEFKVKAEISGIVGRAGTKALLGGWQGNNKIAWDAFSFTPVLSDPMTGTFTPSLQFGGANVGMVYNERRGSFTRIGNLVSFSLAVSATVKGTSVGPAQIAGFPFPVQVGQARGTYTALFGAPKLGMSPSGSTTPDVYAVTVNTLTYGISAPGSGGASGSYPLTLTGGTGSGGSATFTVVGADAVLAVVTPIAAPGTGGTDGIYECPYVGGGGTAPADGDHVRVVVAGGSINSAAVIAHGSGFTSPPDVNLSSIPGLTGASVTVALGVGGVTDITVKTRGSYTVAPTATATASGLTGAVITVALNTAGVPIHSEIIGRMSSDVGCQLALDVADGGVILTSTEFPAAWFLRMVGWYFLVETADVDAGTDA